MGSAASRIQALDGPWELHTYARTGSYRVQFHDTDGTNVTIAQCWDPDFADLLTRAWAVPKLMDALQRVANTMNDPDDGHVIQELAFLVPQMRALLEQIA